MPPLVRAPGHRSLISGSASMNAFANSSCSSIPVATARMFGSKIDVLGREPGLLGQEPVRALADLDLALDRLRLALLVERHDDDAGAVARGSCRACSRNGSSPSLSEIELTIALALEALEPRLDDRPARAVDHDRQPRGLGLGREQVEEASSSPARRRAGRRPCSRRGRWRRCAPARAPPRPRLEVAGLDERAEPGRAGDVRPLADHHEPRVRADLERLEPAPARPRRGRAGRGRGAMPSTAAAICADVLGRRPAAAADEVDEAVLGERAEEAARVARAARRARPSRSAARRSDSSATYVSRDPRELLEERPHLGRAERAVDADDERPACSTETQNASDVWPERFRPLRSMAVNESQSGSSGATSRAATIAAFAFSVSKIVSTGGGRRRLARARRSARRSVSRTCVERDGAEARVVDLRRDARARR